VVTRLKERRAGPGFGRRHGRETVGDSPAGDGVILRTTRLTVELGGHAALRDIELTVRAGELVALAGEPGAGKTTLVRCVAGDLAPSTGEIVIGGRTLPADPMAARRRGVSVVWQDLALCDNLDVAGNVLLGSETRRLMFSDLRFHIAASDVLSELRIPIQDVTRLVGELPDGDRRLIAVARALTTRPRLLLLDEPTAAMGTAETSQLEELITRLHAEGTTVLLVSRDPDQMFRIADRIVVLRHGQIAGELDPRAAHPDDLAALQSGRRVDSSARRQLTRLHRLSDRLISADPASSLSLILSALGSALNVQRLCIHVADAGALECEAALGFTEPEIAVWSRLAVGDEGGLAGRAAAGGELVVCDDPRDDDWPGLQGASEQPIASAWSMPVMGPDGVSAVITAFSSAPGGPGPDQLDLLSLYAGYAAGAVERERLLRQVTARNRVLETTREMLETLAGPVAVADGLLIALHSLCRGLECDEVALVTRGEAGEAVWRAYAGPDGTDPSAASQQLADGAVAALGERRDGTARTVGCGAGRQVLIVAFNGPAGPTALLARWASQVVTEQETALVENAAHSLGLALEREAAGIANQEAVALRRSRQLQRGFLSRLSHELRTPLTAIRGYASSLMAPDVTWDPESQRRFLARIAAESARVGRLVDDLLDFSAIESGVMRLQPDWCDLPLVIEAAVDCLPAAEATRVTVTCNASLPSIWADHDRLEQVFVNLFSNAFRHNPPGTHVSVSAGAVQRRDHAPEVEILVADDGIGFPSALADAPFEASQRRRSRSSGAGLGLSIANGIVLAHGGLIELLAPDAGTSFRILLPVEAPPGNGTRASELVASPGTDAPTARPVPTLVAGAPGVGGRG
jgi:signal transduction histidine kinase/ABC-type branched-subunit amino acid transport system ATPase component